MKTTLTAVALLLASGTGLFASSPVVREMGVQQLSQSAHEEVPVPPAAAKHGPRRMDTDAAAIPTTNASAEPELLAIYPVAGRIGQDVVVPYYVDLDPSSKRLDWNCGDLTFNNHTGHDPYIRSFAEQRIGVPVYAARDGRVIDVRSNEPDENTTNNTSARANYVTIRHDDDDISQYVHLRRDVLVSVNENVFAGQQIGWVGSSGASTAPHIHFEVRHEGTAYEPLAGPCRPGRPYFASIPEITASEPVVQGVTFSRFSFANYSPAPYDDAPHTGTFARGPQTIYFKAEMANVGASTRYRILLERPGSTRTVIAAAGTLRNIDQSLYSIWWGLDVDLDQTGEWAVVLEINERTVFREPFTVVSNPSLIVNRPPNPITATIGPVGLAAGQVPLCTAMSSASLADPDYDVVRYRYEWRVDGVVVRSVTTASQSDALSRQYSTAGANLTCTVTPSDASVSAQPAQAFATVGMPKRRAVGRR